MQEDTIYFGFWCVAWFLLTFAIRIPVTHRVMVNSSSQHRYLMYWDSFWIWGCWKQITVTIWTWHKPDIHTWEGQDNNTSCSCIPYCYPCRSLQIYGTIHFSGVESLIKFFCCCSQNNKRLGNNLLGYSILVRGLLILVFLQIDSWWY